MPDPKTFTTTLLLHGKNATGIEIPDAIVDGFDAGRKPPVVVSINSHSYRTTVAPRGGVYLVPASAEVRKAAGIQAGDEIEVTIHLDTEPRVVEVPTDFAAALKAAGLRETFDKLAPSHKKEHVRAITEAKAAATRERRIAKAIEKLQA